jgi:hypothetical protein
MPVEMHFKRDGSVTMKPFGYNGKTCHEATRPYEQAMAGQKDYKEGEAPETERLTQNAAARATATQTQKVGH